jgi:hypothetical protein
MSSNYGTDASKTSLVLATITKADDNGLAVSENGQIIYISNYLTTHYGYVVFNGAANCGDNIANASAIAFTTTSVGDRTAIACTKSGSLVACVNLDGTAVYVSGAPAEGITALSIRGDALDRLTDTAYYGKTAIQPKVLDVGTPWQSYAITTGKDYPCGACLSSTGKYITIGNNTTTTSLQISSDFGTTFVKPNLNGSAIAALVYSTCMSSDGQIQYAGNATNGTVIRSTDYGANFYTIFYIWYNVRGMCCSEDGSIVCFVSAATYINISRDFGNTWTASTAFISTAGASCTMSSDGVTIYVVSYTNPGLVYQSRDSGTTFTQILTTGQTNVTAPSEAQTICCSSDGRVVFVTGGYSGLLCKLSKDYGLTWVDVGAGAPWFHVSMNNTGEFFLISGYNSWEYLSNYGATTYGPVSTSGSNNSFCVGISGDGSIQVLGSNDGTIWVNKIAHTKATGLTITGNLDSTTETRSTDMKEPNGFVNRADSSISFAYPTFTIAPKAPATSYSYYIGGRKYSRSIAATVDITDTEGIWYFYFNPSNVLTATQSPSYSLLTDVSIANLYWDAVNNAALFLLKKDMEL